MVREVDTHLDREVVYRVPSELAYSQMAGVAAALQQRDACSECGDLLLLLLQLSTLLFDFLVRNTL